MRTTATIKSTVDKCRQTHTKRDADRERIMANTMSVDDYFDELIDQVRSHRRRFRNC